VLPESQCGFRAGRSTLDTIFSVRQLQEKCAEQQRPLYMVFVDLTKAFDSVSRSGLFHVLQRLGCPATLLAILQGFHDGMRATIQFNGARSNEFDVCCGVKQGCVLAPTLFGIYFSAVLRRAFPDPVGVMLHTRYDGNFFSLARLRARTRVKCVLVRELLYADDAAFVAHTEQEIQEMCNSFAAACTEFGLTISLKKTVVMAQNVPAPPHVTINGTVLSVVEKFIYLGSTLTANNSLDAELNTRIGRASTTFGRLQSRVWNNSHLSLKVKVRVYESCVLSVLLYGSETWPTYRRQEHKLNAFHFRCLRQILGLSWQDRVPNTTVLKLTNSSDMYTAFRRRRLRWIGHVRRMPDERLPKSIFHGELAVGHRPRGRPKLRFKDVVKRDMNVFNINPAQWHHLAEDRAAWRSALTEGTIQSCYAYTSFCSERRHARHRSDRRLRCKRP
jgi:hypothetical protein